MTPGPLLGIVTGLPAETRAAHRGRGDRIRVLCSNASTARAEIHARSLIDRGAAALLSFGTAGGLRSGLRAGTVVIATAIVSSAGDEFEIDGEWAARLDNALTPSLDTVQAPIAGAENPVADAPAKAALGRFSKAAAVDMESHAVARICASAGLPAMALRVIADPADRGLPPSLVAALSTEDGSLVQRVLVEASRRPGDLPALIRLSVDYRRALRSLRRVAVLCGSCFGFGL